MITTPTVLVLGAGASAWAGFPVGKHLRQAIIGNLNDRRGAAYTRLQQLQFEDARIQEFRDSFKNSGKLSVDAFLEHRPDLLDVGKAAISQELIAYEGSSRLFEGDMDWYAYLYQRMNSPFMEFGSNKVSIVTFNYDRSIEHFLFTSLKHTYRKGEDKVAEVLSDIPIIHVHGRLGHLPWQKDGGRSYSQGLTPDEIRIAAAGIRIIHEQLPRDKEFEKARAQIASADRIVFLGFGYDETNLNRLIPRVETIDRKCMMFGSVYRFTTAEHTDEICTFLRKPRML